MEDGIKIRVDAELGKLKETSDKFKMLATLIKELDYDFRKNKISAEQLSSGLKSIESKASTLNGTLKQNVDLQASVYQVQQRASVGFKSLAVSVDGTTKAVRSVGAEVRTKAVPSVLELSRIVQDAPYGIRGMANNIQQLSTNFVSLQKAAGGTVPAIKAMLSSMVTGPLGVMMAISLVSSLAVAFGDKLFGGVKKANDEAKKLDSTMLRLIENLNKLGDISDQSMVNMYKAQIVALESANKQTETKTAYLPVPFSPIPMPMRVEGMKLSPEEQRENLVAITELRLKIQAIEENIVNRRKEQTNELKEQEKLDKEILAEGTKQAKFMVQYEQDSLDRGIARHKKASAERIKIKKDEAKRRKKIEEDEAKRRKKIEDAVNRYVGNAEQALWDGLNNGFNRLMGEFSSAWEGMWARNIGNAETVVAKLVQAIAEQFAALAARLAAMQLFSWIFPGMGFLAGGGDVVSGGSQLQFAANGGNFNYGNLQNVIVGENGAELMQVGKNGVRIISNNNLQAMSQMSQSSRGGNGGYAQMAKAINNLNAQVSRLSTKNGDDILTMSTLAKQARRGRIG